MKIETMMKLETCRHTDSLISDTNQSMKRQIISKDEVSILWKKRILFLGIF